MGLPRRQRSSMRRATSALEGATTSAQRTATTATVTVEGFSLSVIPGWKPTVRAERHCARREAHRAVRWDRGEQRSASIEAAVGVPAFVLFVGLIIFGGRTATTHQAVESAAADAARSASLERTAAEAEAAAEAAARSSLANQDIDCLAVGRRRRHQRVRHPGRPRRLRRGDRYLPTRPVRSLGPRRARQPNTHGSP